ncbi:MAG: hypothetical protein LBH81_01575 [Rickettsiales bacterium]|jgi:type IV secretion system protein VirB4|nr:hypothetical protein [Rickettsiales bacterium]
MEALEIIFTKDSSFMTAALMAAAAFGIFIVFLIYLGLLGKIAFPKFGYKSYAEYLPFKYPLDDKTTVLLENGRIFRVYAISGIQTNMTEPEKQRQFLDIRTRFLQQMQGGDTVLRFFMARSRDYARTDFEFDERILQDIHDQWNNQGLKLYKNSYYLVISAGNMENLSAASNSFESVFAPYGVSVLKHDSADNAASFYSKILSPLSESRINLSQGNFSDLAATNDVSFQGGHLEYSSGDRVKYAACLSFRTAPDWMDEEFFTSLSSLQSEIVVMNGMIPMSRRAAESHFNKKQISSDNERSFNTVSEQIEETLGMMDEDAAGSQNLFDYYPLFMLRADSSSELLAAIAEFQKICANFGITSAVENFGLKPAFFSMTPGFDDFPRSYKLLSSAAAASVPCALVPGGFDNSDWGQGPIAVFPTAEGTPYKFQFHVSQGQAAAAHSIVIGPTGQGKTTLFSFLISQSMRHPKLKSFFFDRNRGAEIFTLSVGGKYLTFENRSQNADKIDIGIESKMNPLMMDGTDADRDFLKRWMSILSGQTDAASLEEISNAVAVNFDYLAARDRKLKNIVPSCFSSAGTVRANMKRWIDDNQYGTIFNEGKDSIDLHSRLTTFDFTNIIDDPALSPGVLSYLLQRINNITLAGGNPSLIMIDETAPMLENEQFRKNFITGLSEGRKNRQAYMAAFQRANILDKLGIGDVVRGQAQTILFFRNPAADASDYENWRLSPMEMAFIQGKLYPNLKRAVLLRRPITNESVVLNTELGGLGPYLRLFESGRKSVLLAEEIYKSQGSNFVWEYLKQSS